MAKGNQWMSWIHIDDIAGIFRLSIENHAASGPLNGTAPNPVRNSEFAKTFSSVLKKPYTPWRVYVPFGPPDGLLRIALGEVATIVTTGQRVLPAKPLELGYQFKYPHIGDACRPCSRRRRPPAAARRTTPAAHGCERRSPLIPVDHASGRETTTRISSREPRPPRISRPPRRSDWRGRFWAGVRRTGRPARTIGIGGGNR